MTCATVMMTFMISIGYIPTTCNPKNHKNEQIFKNQTANEKMKNIQQKIKRMNGENLPISICFKY